MDGPAKHMRHKDSNTTKLNPRRALLLVARVTFQVEDMQAKTDSLTLEVTRFNPYVSFNWPNMGSFNIKQTRIVLSCLGK